MPNKNKLSIRYFIVGLFLLAIFVLISRNEKWPNLPSRPWAGSFSLAGPSAYLFERFSVLRNVSDAIINFRQLSGENVSLKKENERLLADHAAIDAVIEENIFLRRTLNLPILSKKTKIAANIYHVSRNVFGYIVMLNRGFQDGISAGQAVITDQGVLVGITQEVFRSTTRILLVSDPAFSATARVFGNSTAGIAKGDGSSGLSLELIVQEDAIAPDDRIVTSGDDILPPGLVLGTVREVSSQPDQVFKKVIISPSAGDFLVGPVMVISRE